MTIRFMQLRSQMEKELPRSEAATAEGPATLRVRWRGKREADVVNLSGWIAAGGDILAPLRDPDVFSQRCCCELRGRRRLGR